MNINFFLFHRVSIIHIYSNTTLTRNDISQLLIFFDEIFDRRREICQSPLHVLLFLQQIINSALPAASLGSLLQILQDHSFAQDIPAHRESFSLEADCLLGLHVMEQEVAAEAELEVGQEPLCLQHQLDVHGEFLPLGVLLDPLDVVHRQTNQEVGDNDRHDEHEDHKQNGGVLGEGNYLGSLGVLSNVFIWIVVFCKHSFKLELSDHHDVSLCQGPTRCIESQLENKNH